jgi:hypothetical protein
VSRRRRTSPSARPNASWMRPAAGSVYTCAGEADRCKPALEAVPAMGRRADRRQPARE